MKIHAITAQNFLGARAIKVRLKTPVTLFAGKNGAGKTSLQEGIRMAFTGESHRAKAIERLLTEGEGAGFVQVDFDQHQAAITVPNGAHELTSDGLPAALPFVLDAQRFTSLSVDDRRVFLMRLMGIKTDGPAVKDRLVARECDPAKIELIMPFLRSGFDNAAKEAKSKASEARGAWKTITGENYGSQKAPKWQAQRPLCDAATLEGLNGRLQDLEAAIGEAQTKLGALQADERRYKEVAEQLTALRETAGKLDRIKAKLQVDEAGLAEWQGKVAAAKAASTGGIRVGLVHDLALAVHGLLNEAQPLGIDRESYRKASTVLGEYCAEHGEIGSGEYDPEAAAKVPDYEKALALQESAVANGKRDLQAAETAAATLVELEKTVPACPEPEQISGYQRRIADLQTERTAVNTHAAQLRDAEAQARAADDKTRQARALHEDVAGWEKIAEALAPEGIRAEILAEALDPVNARMHSSCESAEWGKVTLHSDMRITMGLRDYAMLSESEQWRVDAVIAEAVSHISGVRMLVLDRFDVLDLKGRADALYWLECLADEGSIDTALLFGTLKALPTGLPECISAYWIENGVTGQMEAAA